MRKEIELTRKGAFIDIDVREEELAKWLTCYADHGGPLDRLTISSDASIKGPSTHFQQI